MSFRIDRSTNVEIRPCHREDAEAIGELASEFHSYLRAHGDKSEFNWGAKQYLRDGFGDNAAFEGLVADTGSLVVGYALYHFGYDSDQGQRLLYLVDLFVSQRFRRNGIGVKLMQRVFEVSKARGADFIVWSVLKRNAEALTFYEKLGARYADDIHVMWCPVEPL